MEGWSTLCLIALSTLLALWFRNSRSGKHHLPPGPWCLPIIGSLHHLFVPLPHRKILELSRRYGPLMLLRLGEVPTVVVSTAEAASLVMKTNDVNFASRPRSPMQEIFGCGGKSMLFAPYGAYWRHMRKVCTMELLSSQQVKRMEGARAQEVGKLVRLISDAAASTGGATVVNVSEKVRQLSNDVVSQAVFRGKFARQEEYLGEMAEAFALLGGLCVPVLFPSSRLLQWLSNQEDHMRRHVDRMLSIISEIIEERQEARAAGDGVGSTDHEDLLDVLLRLQKEDSSDFPLTAEVIRAILFDMFAGGTETTGTSLEWAMSELIRNPEAMAKAQQEIQYVLGPNRTVITNSELVELQYMRMFIKEVLRLHPPAPFIVRTTIEDCKLMGYDMLKGTSVLVDNFAVATDPKYWENPEVFNPERFVNNKTVFIGTHFEFTPFGAGRRQCPGILFATSTLEIAFANLLYHFNWVVPDGKSPQSLDMSKQSGITIGGRRCDLQLRAIPHVYSKATQI